jgi:hypothetical protein
MCAQSNRRALNVHVEYESDAWISVFNVTLSLSRIIKVVGSAYANTANDIQLVVDGEPAPLRTMRGSKEVVEAIEVVMTCLLGVSNSTEGELPMPTQPPLCLAALHRAHGDGQSHSFLLAAIV